MAEEESLIGEGDKLKQHSPTPEAVKVPDVELIVDGFGFMPKRHSETLQKILKEIIIPEEHSVCMSSSNIDIIRRFTWKTKNRMICQVISYGATVTSIIVPDRKGVSEDVLAGFDTFEEYLQPLNPYFGATIGRYANIIPDATMTVKPGKTYMLSTNRGHDHYHGGYIGFDKVNWRSYVKGNAVIMTHVSDRLLEGYPGTVMAQITFEVTCDNSLHITMRCTTNEPTALNLSNALYFNLAGHNAGNIAMKSHIFTVNADKYTPVDEFGYTLGTKKCVGGSPFDFRIPRCLSVMLPRMPFGGYDINYCITRGAEQDLTFQARVLHPVSGRVLELYSNQPGMQFYTGNLLPDPDKIYEENPVEEETESVLEDESKISESTTGSKKEEAKGEEADDEMREERIGEEEGIRRYGYRALCGKNCAEYKKHGLFCLMPQNYPDAVNQCTFPNATLNPGEEYVHHIQFKFGILLGRYI